MPAIGDVVEVYLERLEDENGQTILSKDKRTGSELGIIF
jgi:ribosomal protein S1